MTEILFHTERLPELAIARLEEAGVIAVFVQDPNSFRFVSADVTSIRCDDFVWACLDAVSKATSSFGDETRKRLIANLASLATEQYKGRRSGPLMDPSASDAKAHSTETP